MNLDADSLRNLVHKVLAETKSNNAKGLIASPLMEQEEEPSVLDPEAAAEPEPEIDTSASSSDVELVLMHLAKINTPQEQIQIMGPLFDVLLGSGPAENKLSKEQRTQAMRKTLEGKYGNQAGPLISALRNLMVKI
tara:strand:+ start:192 stop:599 length:408 start_codon:yes stop_codon:yes gene_type:complete